MARLLTICDRFPDDLASGRLLRVHHFCRQLAERHECFFMDLSGETDTRRAREVLGMADAASAPPVPAGRGSAWRHLRVSNVRYLRLSHPQYVRTTLALLREQIRRWQIDVVMVFPGETTELALDLDLPRIMDFPDCDTLTIRRALDNRGSDLTLKQRSALWLRSVRQGARERGLVRGFDVVTTIAEPDRLGLLASARVAGDRVVVVPNGVAEAALAAGERDRPATKSIVFWGNLDFPPNWTAIRYFFDAVFVPYLVDKGVTWHIYGRGAGEHLRDVMSHPRVRAEGFRERLFEDVVDRGVMINPMVEGSGLKNKVLEAFACRVPVVTTSLGVEALGVADGRECLIADDPAAMARSVLTLLDTPQQRRALIETARRLVEEQYTWPTIGDRLGAIVDRLAASSGRVDRSRAPTRGAA